MTSEEANEIQREWMELDSSATEKEKQRVFALMRKLPQSYISQAPNGEAMVMVQGQPAHAFNEPIAANIERAKRMGVQTRLRWNTTGHWSE